MSNCIWVGAWLWVLCVCYVCTLIGLLCWYALERVSGEIHLIMSPAKPRQPYMYMYTYYMHMIHVHAHVNLSVCTMYIIPRVQHKQECTPIQFGRGVNEFHMELWPARCIFLVVVDIHVSYWGASEGLNGVDEATNYGREPCSLLNYRT